MPDLGVPELLIILVVVLLFFGGAKLPKLARSLGEAKREFAKGHEEDSKDEPKAEDPKAS
jgi:sec-independent protein translocase protein TatA